MVAVFHRVSADIAPDFIENFPVQFDFKGMLKKICDDVGVAITIIGNSYNIEGQWNTVGKAHNMLVSTLAVYGSTNVVRQEQEGVLSHGSRPFSALVEAAEAISRGVELQEQVQKEMMGMDRISDHKYTSFPTDSEKQTSISDVNSVIKQDMSFHESHSSDTKSNSDLDMPSDSECYDNILYEDDSDTKNLINYQNNGNMSKMPLDNDGSGRNQNIFSNENSKDVEQKLVIDTETKNRESELPLKSEKAKTNQRNKNNQCDSEETKKGRKKKTFPCNQCDFIGKTEHAISDHKCQRHEAEISKVSKCDICKKIFSSQRYMRRHRASHNETMHACKICGKQYKVLKTLKEHMKRHEETYVKPEFNCDKCPKSFSSSYVLLCHVKSEHLGIKKSFLCQTCGKSFTTKHTLQQHVNVHVGVRPYKCTECDKSFHYESALRDHRNIHEGTKKFVCSFEGCNKAFRQGSALKMHQKIHRETKDFTCSLCDRGFTQKQALQRHLRSHKGVKPFSCKFCHRKFGEASVIRRHLILVHKVSKDPSEWREDIEQTALEEIDSTSDSIEQLENNKVDLNQPTNNNQLHSYQTVVDSGPINKVPLPPVSALHTGTYGTIESFTHQLHSEVSISNSQVQPASHSNQICSVPPHHDYVQTTLAPTSYNYTATPLTFSLNSNCKNTTVNENESHHAVSNYEIPVQHLEQGEVQQLNSQNEKAIAVQYLHSSIDDSYTVIDVDKLQKNFEAMTKPNPSLDKLRLSVTQDAGKELSEEGRLNESAETLENVNMSQFYSYYTSLGGHYLNAGHYNYISPSAETTDNLS